MNRKPSLFGIVEMPWEFNLPVAPSVEIGNTQDSTLNDCSALNPLFTLHDQPMAVQVDTFCEQLALTIPTADGQLKPVNVPQHVTVYIMPDQRRLILSQHDGPNGSSLVYQVGAGVTRHVSLGDVGGLLIQGQWENSKDSTSMNWAPLNGGTAVWSVGQRVFSLTGLGFNGDELVNLAHDVKV